MKCSLVGYDILKKVSIKVFQKKKSFVQIVWDLAFWQLWHKIELCPFQNIYSSSLLLKMSHTTQQWSILCSKITNTYLMQVSPILLIPYFCFNIVCCDFFGGLIWCSESSKSLKHAHFKKVEHMYSITFIAQLPTYIKFQIAKLLTASELIPTFSPKMSHYIDDGSIDPQGSKIY